MEKRAVMEADQGGKKPLPEPGMGAQDIPPDQADRCSIDDSLGFPDGGIQLFPLEILCWRTGFSPAVAAGAGDDPASEPFGKAVARIDAAGVEFRPKTGGSP